MLVLSRKKGEQIRIGDDIVITVQRMSGNRVSLGIEAPAKCRITRGELLSLLNEFAASTDAESTDEPTSAKKPVGSTARPTRNTPPDVVGENRIAPHLPAVLRMPK